MDLTKEWIHFILTFETVLYIQQNFEYIYTYVNRNFTSESNLYVSGMLTEINLCMPYSFHKVASISPNCSYLGQLVIIRDIVQCFLTCTDHIHLIAQNFVNILSMVVCILMNGIWLSMVVCILMNGSFKSVCCGLVIINQRHTVLGSYRWCQHFFWHYLASRALFFFTFYPKKHCQHYFGFSTDYLYNFVLKSTI